MPAASNYTSKVRFAASVKNTKVQLPSSIGNLTQSGIAGCGLSKNYAHINYVESCKKCAFVPPTPSVVTIINDIPVSSQYLGIDFNSNETITISWSCVPLSQVTLNVYVQEVSFVTLEPLGDFSLLYTVTSNDTTFTIGSPVLFKVFISISPTIGSAVNTRTVFCNYGL
jgi:hypothetical protein